MTETRCGGMHARSTVFSLDVCETHTTWCTSASVNLSTLLVRMDATSAKPKSEWSVKTVGRPIVRACRMASWAMVEKAWWPCTTPMRSSRMMDRSRAKPPKSVGSVSLRWKGSRGA